MKKLVVLMLSLALVITAVSCAGLPKSDAKFDYSCAIATASDGKSVFAELKKQLPLTLAKHNFSYEVSGDAYADRKYKNPKEGKTDILDIDDALLEVSTDSYIYVEFTWVPVRTYFELNISVSQDAVNISFNDLNTLNGFSVNRFQLNKFKPQARLFVEDLLRPLKDKNMIK